jgi:murein DD-endopeptidase MepM/ murein hydrolase activator NlpD
VNDRLRYFVASARFRRPFACLSCMLAAFAIALHTPNANAQTNATAPASKSVASSSMGFPRELRVPGGVALLRVGDANTPRPKVTRDGQRVWVVQRDDAWFAVVGIPLSISPGEHAIEVMHDGKTSTQRFQVKPKKYPVQQLRLNRAMVDPPPETMARIERESAHLKNVRNTWRASETTNAAFALPSEGPLSSRFGLARVLNGKPRSPHAGLDVAVPTGTPVTAPGDGIVIDADDYYFCGKTMFIDHGNGLITMHCHLSEFVAKVGDTVKQGDRIALSGVTGRATGPHLHWTVYLNGVAVEPELFVRLPK